MKQVMVQDLKPGDVIAWGGVRARVTDVPARSYEGGVVHILVPTAVGEQQFAAGDFVTLRDRQLDDAVVIAAIAMVMIVAVGLIALASAIG